MNEQWVLARAGFHGPPHLIDILDLEFEGVQAAADDGFSADEPNPLVTSLFLFEAYRAVSARMRLLLEIREANETALRSLVSRSPNAPIS
jgi:hypothetical protein